MKIYKNINRIINNKIKKPQLYKYIYKIKLIYTNLFNVILDKINLNLVA